MRRHRYDEYADPITYWCWECGKECVLDDDGDERGPAAETRCCGSRNYEDTPPWCWHCGNITVADWQQDDEGARMCLDCAWSDPDDRRPPPALGARTP